jgi:SulP family sulfate permease
MPHTGAKGPLTPASNRGERIYSWFSFRADLVAGLTVAAVAVPQAMAYALIAGVEPHYGLYTAIVMTALASIFGSSVHLINGPTNAISLVVLGAVAGLSAGPNAPSTIEVIGLLGIMVGLLQILIALLGLGDLTRYISESVILGFMAGAGLLVAVTQVQNLLGLKAVGVAEPYLPYRLWKTWTHGGPIDWQACGIGLFTVAMVALFHRVNRRFRIRLPELLLSLILVSLGVWLLGLTPQGADRLEVKDRLPRLQVPSFTRQTWELSRQLWSGAVAIALLGLVEALAIAKSIAARTRQRLNYNRQCLAEGIANLGGGFFQCLPGSGSLTRSAINFFAGAVSRLSGLYSAAAVALTLVLFAPLASYVPRAALAGILMWTAYRIVDRKRLWDALRATPLDRNLAVATAFSAVFVSIEFSVLIGVILSFVFFVPRASRLLASELVVNRQQVIRERQPDDPPCGKLVVLGLEGELYFGAAPELEQHLDDLRNRAREGTRVIVLRLKRTRNPDMVCLERLIHFLEDMEKLGVIVLLSGVRRDFADVLARLDSHRVMPADRIFLETGKFANNDSRTPAMGSPAREEMPSSTVRAVRRAYELLGDDLCSTCPRRQAEETDKGWSYMI